jgi:hypothetical protein
MKGNPEGEQLCPACAVQTPRCAACHCAIYASYFEDPVSGAIYCEACQNRGPRCGVCGCAAGVGARLLHDGRHICASCDSTAVYEPGRAEELYRHVIQLAEQTLGLRVNLLPLLLLVDRGQMLSALRQAGLVEIDHPDLVFGLYIRRGRRRVIYAESGLPQIMLIQVLAHEHAHAWQGENCPLLHDLLPYEGFAEWVAYKTLMAMRAVKKAALMEARGDLYGQGLRMLLDIERTRGPAGVICICRQAFVRRPTGNRT